MTHKTDRHLYIVKQTDKSCKLLCLSKDPETAIRLSEKYMMDHNLDSYAWWIEETSVTNIHGIKFDNDTILMEEPDDIAIESLSNYLFELSWLTKTIILKEDTETDTVLYTAVTVEIAEGTDFYSSAKYASMEYCMTPKGRVIYANHGKFDWREFLEYVPNEISVKYGIRVIHTEQTHKSYNITDDLVEIAELI